MYRVLIFVGLVAAAMMTGLMAVLLSVMRPMWRAEPDAVAARGLQDFLALASRNPVLVVLTLLPPIVGAVIAFAGAPSPGQYFSALVGGGVYFVGFTAWTVAFNLPIYRRVAAWQLPGEPADVRAALAAFHRANVARLAAAAATAVLFFLAV